LIGALTALRK